MQRPLSQVALPPDARWEELWRWIQQHLMHGKLLRDDERLIIFTEYKHSLDYLMERLGRAGLARPQVECLFGGATSEQRELIKDAFNDPRHPLRILVGTDTVSEGISLQMTCRYVVHQEIPWNPMRLEQRNGRVDRHGQERDVFTFHFSSDDEADLQFMASVVKKVDQTRKDLGSVGQVIDSTVVENFTRRSVSLSELDSRIEEARRDPQEETDLRERDRGDRDSCWRAMQRLNATEMGLELSPEHAAQLLMQAVSYEDGSLESVEDGQAYRFRKVPLTWKKLIKETIERPNGIPKLVFDPAYFEEEHAGRRFFKPRLDAELVRLAHPLMQCAIGVLRRQMWDSKGLTRWTLYRCPLPQRAHEVLILHLLLEVTNEFHETAHQEIITLPFEMHGPDLSPLEETLWQHYQALPRQGLSNAQLERWVPYVREYWPDHRRFIRDLIKERQAQAHQDFTRIMRERYQEERKDEKQIFSSRLAELEKQKQPPHLKKLQHEIEQLQKKLAQRSLFAEFRQQELLDEQRLQAISWEERATNYLDRMKELVAREQKRILEQVLPKRYAVATIDIQPVAIEYLVRG